MVRPILALDTATRRSSLAIEGEAGSVIVEELGEGGRHAAGLLPAIEALLRRAGVAARDLAGLAVVIGPGSFTGLRVGLATAKGLGYALDVPVEGLSTLEAIARAAGAGLAGERGTVCALIEAGRGELYAARFEIRGDEVRRLDPDAAWKPAALATALPAATLLAGDAAARLAALDPSRFRVVETPCLAPAVAAWARSVIVPGAGYRAGGPAPNYVRSSGAEAARRPS